MTVERLSPIERQTLAMLANGATYREIKNQLKRSMYSVRKDIEIIRDKTQIKNRIKLALFAVARGYAENPYDGLRIKEVVPNHCAGHD